MTDPNALIALGTLLLAAAGGIAFWSVRISKGENALDVAKRVERDLAEFKVHVAANYASNSTIAEMEGRLIDAINRLGDRLDRVLERRPTRG